MYDASLIWNFFPKMLVAFPHQDFIRQVSKLENFRRLPRTLHRSPDNSIMARIGKINRGIYFCVERLKTTLKTQFLFKINCES